MEFTTLSIIVLIIAFLWSGFVRACFGFGGAGLMYPIAFLVVDSVLFIVPIVGFHLLFFSGITLAMGGYKKVDWKTTLILLALISPTTLMGIFGLLELPEFWVLMSVYAILILYSLSYIFDFKSAKPNPWLNVPALLVGGYVSGLSLSGAPIIAAVALQYLHKEQARSSMYVLWFVLVTIKMLTLYAYDVDMQWQYQLWLLPIATVGHLMGLRLHDYLLQMQNQKFYRWMGIALLSLSIIGLARHFL